MKEFLTLLAVIVTCLVLDNIGHWLIAGLVFTMFFEIYSCIKDGVKQRLSTKTLLVAALIFGIVGFSVDYIATNIINLFR